MEYWRVLALMVMMVGAGSVKRALRVRHLDGVFTGHLCVVRPDPILILVVVLIQFNHRELLLKRAGPVLLSHSASLHVMVVSPLVLRGGLNHLPIIGAVLL